MKRTRSSHRATLKAQVAVAALKRDKTLAESAKQFSVYSHPEHGMEAAIADPGRGWVWRAQTTIR